MAPNRPRGWTIPLTFRVIFLRLIVTFGTACVLHYISIMIKYQGDHATLYWFSLVVMPSLMIVHHVLRLWTWKYWLIMFELLVSLTEALAVIVAFYRIAAVWNEGRKTDKDINLLPSWILLIGMSMTMAISSIFTLLFLWWDTISSCATDLLHPYDFSAGLCPQGCQWGLIFGRHNTRKRFSTDNRFMRCIRGGLAILCFFAVLRLAYELALSNPMPFPGRTIVTTYRDTIPGGNISSLFQLFTAQDYTLNVFLTVGGNASVPDQYPTMNLSLKYLFTNHSEAVGAESADCTGGRNLTYVQASCPFRAFPQVNGDMIEILVTIDFPEVPSDSQVYLRIGGSTDPAGTVATAEPIGLGPGSNIHGTSSLVAKRRLMNVNNANAIFGMSNYFSFWVINVRGQSTDWLNPLPRNNNTATLRVTMRTQNEIETEIEEVASSVIEGLAQIGGIWTLIKGAFAAIFGSTLLLQLFGIKPLSVYGLVHFFHPGKVYLEEGNATFSPEERDRILGILKTHLLDVDETEEDEGDLRSQSDYKALSIVSHSSGAAYK